MSEFEEMSMPSDKMETEFRFEKKLETIFPSREDWRDGNTPVEGEVIIFTDGSKKEEGTGGGVHCEELNLNVSVPLGIYPTMFQAEVLAV